MAWWTPRKLESKDTSTRLQAIEDLSRSSGSEATEELIRALRDKDSSVRAATAEALGRLQLGRAFEPLLDLLADQDSNVRVTAVTALEKIDASKAVEVFLRMLNHADLPMKKAIVSALGRIRDPRALCELTALTIERDKSLREQVMSALVQIDRNWMKTEAAGVACGILTGALVHSDSEVRRHASRILPIIAPNWMRLPTASAAVPTFVVALRSGDSFVRFDAAKVLGVLADLEAIAPLEAALDDADSSVRREVARSLGNIGERRSIRPLAGALVDDNREVRTVARESLEKIDVNWLASVEVGGSTPTMIAALAASDKEARRNTAKLLDSIDPHWPASEAARTAVPALISALERLIATAKRETSFEVGYAISDLTKTLGRIGDSRALGTLTKVVTGREGIDAIEALLKIDPNWNKSQAAREVVPELLKSLQHEDLFTRSEAVKVLGQLLDSRALVPLIEALADYQLSARAAEALDRVDSDWARSQHAGDAMKGLVASANAGSVPALLRIYREWTDIEGAKRVLLSMLDVLRDTEIRHTDKEERRRLEARRAVTDILGEIGDRCAIEPLLAGLKNWGDEQLRTKSAAALDHVDPSWRTCPETKRFVLQLIDEIPKNARAAEALGVIGDPETIVPLMAALKDTTSDVQKSAATALGRFRTGAAVEHLIVTLEQDSYGAQAAAARAMGESGDLRAVEPLVRALQRDSEVRKAATEALLRIATVSANTRQVSTALETALELNNRDICESAAEILLKIGDPHAVKPLVLAVKNARSFVPELTIKAAEKLGGIANLLGEQGLFTNLLDLTTNTELAAKALSEVRDLSTRGATYISVDDLRVLASMVRLKYWYYGDPHDDADHSGIKEADCSDLSRLANQELSRRGLKA
jgi:HEAT repeat protein